MGSLGDRMKSYEETTIQKLHTNLPIILRIDGRAFHTLTRGLNKPFDDRFINMMNAIGIELCENEIQNVHLAYIQSDEISFLIYSNPEQSDWFNNRVQKMCSIASARASAYATKYNIEKQILKTDKLIMFDARVFMMPKNDVENYFIWRQLDWTRNSIQMLARSLYSHRELHHKNQSDMQEMIFQKGYNWNDLPIYLKRGRCIRKYDATTMKGVDRKIWDVDNNIPIFTKNRNYIRKHLECDII